MYTLRILKKQEEFIEGVREGQFIDAFSLGELTQIYELFVIVELIGCSKVKEYRKRMCTLVDEDSEAFFSYVDFGYRCTHISARMNERVLLNDRKICK